MFKKIADADVRLKWTCEKCHIDVVTTPQELNSGAGIPICKRCGNDMEVAKTMVRTPRVILFVEGGVVHDVMADAPVQLRVIDYDVEGSDNVKRVRLVSCNNKLLKHAQLCHIIKYDLDGVEDLEPFFKQRSIR